MAKESQLTKIQTTSGTDYEKIKDENAFVRMVDKDGNSVQVKRDSFVAAIRDALPSLLSDKGTVGGSVLSVINGVLGTRTDDNLASVLGVDFAFHGTLEDMNKGREKGVYQIQGSNTNTPNDIAIYGTLVTFSTTYEIGGRGIQLLSYNNADTVYIRVFYGTIFNNWHKLWN